MLQLVLGLVLFLGMHSVSIFAVDLRDRLVAKNERGWKLFYAVVSLVGFVLIVRGYSELKETPTFLYVAPAWLYHVAAVLLLPTFVFFLAPYLPGRIKRTLKHPQLVAVKLWAVAHLLVNGTLADVLLFGSFLVWAVADRISLKRRPARPVQGAPESGVNDIILIVLGLALYAATVLWLHQLAFGVKPIV